MEYKLFKLQLESFHYTTWKKDKKVREAFIHYKRTGEIKYDNGRKIRKSSKVSKRN